MRFFRQSYELRQQCILRVSEPATPTIVHVLRILLLVCYLFLKRVRANFLYMYSVYYHRSQKLPMRKRRLNCESALVLLAKNPSHMWSPTTRLCFPQKRVLFVCALQCHSLSPICTSVSLAHRLITYPEVKKTTNS